MSVYIYDIKGKWEIRDNYRHATLTADSQWLWVDMASLAQFP